MVETIAKGIEIREQGSGIGTRLVSHHRGHEAILSLYKEGLRETWSLTGFKAGISDINSDVSQIRAPIFFKQDQVERYASVNPGRFVLR